MRIPLIDWPVAGPHEHIATATGANPRHDGPRARRTIRRLRISAAIAALVALCLIPVPAAAQTARDLFTSAQALEHRARSAMVAKGTTASSVLRAIRTAVDAYERVAGRTPDDGYVDAALWSAAELAGDGFGAFGQERDRQTAIRLARKLLDQFPESAYLARAAEHLARLAALRFAGPAAVHGIEQRVVSEGTEVDIDLERGVWFRTVRLENPPRLYFDLYNTQTPAALQSAVRSYDTGAVAQLRLGHHPHHTTRVVLEGEGVHGCVARLSSNPARLSVFCRSAVAIVHPPLPETPEPRPWPSLIPPDLLAAAAPPLLQARRLGEMVTPVPPPEGLNLHQVSRRVSVPPLASSLGPASAPVTPVPVPANQVDIASQAVDDRIATNGSASPVALPSPSPVDDGEAWHATEPPADWLWIPPGAAPVSEPAPVPGEAEAEPAPAAPLPSRPFTAHIAIAPAVRQPILKPLPDGRPAASLPLAPLLFAEPMVPSMAATRPTVQVAAAAQFLSGDELRIGSQALVQPDLGVQLAYPDTRIGSLYADANVTSRGGRPVLGRGLIRLHGFRTAGLTWSLGAGDTLAAPITPDFGFSNLFAPPVNLRGISVSGRSDRTSVTASAARLTARRNIFGTDTLPTGQQLIQVAVSHRPDRFLEVFARASDVRGNSPIGYTALVELSREAGGGARFRPSSSWELVADVGYSAFRRTGSPQTEQDVSALLGAAWTGTKGWLQVNATRFALGHYAVGNYPYNDRSSVFTTGEWWPSHRLRLYAGADVARNGLDPAAAAQATVSLPPGTSTRGFGGFRVQLGPWSTLGTRVEGGGREIHPSKFGAGFTTDTGAISADWNIRLGATNALVRYERRSSVDAGIEGSDFTQHDGTAQIFLPVGGGQIFLQGLLSQRIDRAGTGQTLWQASGGSQVPLGRLYVRFEGALGHTRDWVTRQLVARQSLSASATGRITAQTQFSVDVYVDHTPMDFQAGNPWVVRTMVRVTHSLSFGASRTVRATSAAPYRGPTGKVTGIVFADWNGNGVADLDEDPVPGVRVIAGPASVTGNHDGRFTLDAVPIGEQAVTLDLTTLPAAYDPPADQPPIVDVHSKSTSRVDFALVPLGSVHGVVYQDVDGDGVLTAADALIDRAVLVLDDGLRTELTREGRFWFDNVRIGSHTVSLLLPSLPEGAQLAGPASVEVALSRQEHTSQVVFVVTMEKRQEIRKVFAPKRRD